jgi:hypothetical protein
MWTTRGTNLVSAHDGEENAKVNVFIQADTSAAGASNSARGMFAQGGENIVERGGEVEITANAAGNALAYGLDAHSRWLSGVAESSTNRVEGDTVMIAAESASGNAAGIRASSANNGPAGNVITGENIVTGRENVTVSAAAGSGNAHGLWAFGGSNSHHTARNIVEGDTVMVSAESTSGNAFGLNAERASQSVLSSVQNIVKGDAVEISAESTSGNAAGLRAVGENITNEVTADSSVKIEADVANGDGGTSRAMNAESGGTNIIARHQDSTSESFNVTIAATKGGGSAEAMFATGAGSTNRIDTGDLKGAEVGITGNIHAANNGRNIIGSEENSTGSATITVNGRTQAQGSGQNLIGREGQDIVNLNDTRTGQALAMDARSGGKNTVEGNSASVIAAGTTDAWAMYAAGTNSVNEVNATGNDEDGVSVTISAAGSNGSSFGLDARSGGENVLDAIGDVNISSSTTGRTEASGFVSFSNAIGLHASGANSSNTVDSKGDVKIDAVGTTNAGARALSAWGGASNTVDGKNVFISADASTGEVNNVFVSVGAAHGMEAEGGSRNVVTALGGHVGIEVTADRTTAHGIYAQGGSWNTVKADTVKIDVSSDNSEGAFGMYANHASSVNTITAGSKVDIDVKLTDSGATRWSNAMHAQDGGENVIEHSGAELAAGERFTVVLTAKHDNPNNPHAHAMWAGANSVNIIDTGKVDSTVELKGRIHVQSGGRNEIVVTDGQNTISLEGHIAAGALNIIKTHEEGTGETILILTADNLDQFNDFYGAWLTRNVLTSGGIIGLEIIAPGVETLADIDWLDALVKAHWEDGFTDFTVRINGGDSIGFESLAAPFGLNLEPFGFDAASAEGITAAAGLLGDITGITVGSDQDDISIAGRASDFDTHNWNGVGLDSGKATIVDFHLGEDFLRFDDLLGQDEALTVETLVEMLQEGVLSLQLQENGVLVFEVHDRTEEHKLLQTVEIQVEGGAANHVAADFNSNFQTQAEMLQQMIYVNSNT